MRVSASVIAAGFAASALAAPGAHRRRSCRSSSPMSLVTSSAVAEPAPSTSVAPVASSSAQATSSTSVAPVTPTNAQSTGAVSSSATAAAAAASSTSSSSSSGGSSSGGFKFFGVSESGAEFGEANIPGTWNTDFIFPNTSAIQVLMDEGMNMFRIPFLMERLAQGSITAALDAEYLANLTAVVNYITEAGAYAVLDPHNYARYDDAIISSTANFGTFWTNLATEFADNAKVVFDCNNEPHDMSTDTQTADLMQACVTAVRGAGATSQYIFVEGTSYTGAWTWTTSGNSEYMANITDDAAAADGLLVYEMHQYLDSDGSGTSETCVNTTIGENRVAAATQWLKDNGKIGIIGEFAGGANSDCETAVTGMLDYLSDNSDVWLGAMWWGAGPWWGTSYIYSFEPPSGTGYVAYKDILSKYYPSS